MISNTIQRIDNILRYRSAIFIFITLKNHPDLNSLRNCLLIELDLFLINTPQVIVSSVYPYFYIILINHSLIYSNLARLNDKPY